MHTLIYGGVEPSWTSGHLHCLYQKTQHMERVLYLGDIISILVKQIRMVRGTKTLIISVVTFSYTTAFWNWTQWELELDWLALRGVNLPLAMVGQEKILVEIFREIGLNDTDISSFLSGPAFQAWNRMGNVQGSWNGKLPYEWINVQFELQKNITRRMVELGMTPVLPCFTNFVPRGFSKLGAVIEKATQWQRFPDEYTNVFFLDPLDPWSARLQKAFITKQAEALGNITHFYALDQFNENDPSSEDVHYLYNVSHDTLQNLKAADSNAIWLMQGWLFSKNPKYWTNERISAYLGGVEDSSMLILDLFSETLPQWQRTHSYFGKPWIWCQLHGYGGNLGLYGQVMNITVNLIKALTTSSSLVGFGLTMEGQEGNEIMYDLLLDQAWTVIPIDTRIYFDEWVRRRYNPPASQSQNIPLSLFIVWNIMRTTVYNNTNSTTESVTKSIFEMSPNIEGMLERGGHHPTTINYDPYDLVAAWKLMIAGTQTAGWLWKHESFVHDLTDITRQVLSNAFHSEYKILIVSWNTSSGNSSSITTSGNRLIRILYILDMVLASNTAFSLSTWIDSARSHAHDPTVADFYEKDARLQITGWGPNGEINDYASKAWGGLICAYYLPRWEIFIQYLTEVHPAIYDEVELRSRLRIFEQRWQKEKGSNAQYSNDTLREVLSRNQDELLVIVLGWNRND